MKTLSMRVRFQLVDSPSEENEDELLGESEHVGDIEIGDDVWESAVSREGLLKHAIEKYLQDLNDLLPEIVKKVIGDDR